MIRERLDQSPLFQLVTRLLTLKWHFKFLFFWMHADPAEQASSGPDRDQDRKKKREDRVAVRSAEKEGFRKVSNDSELGEGRKLR